METGCRLKSTGKSVSCTVYEKEVEDVLTELNLNNDSLDRSDFDVVAYINEMFPTEQSLANIDEAIAETEKKIFELDTETRDIVRGRWQSEDDGQEVVQEAMQMIQSLFIRIRDVQDRATRSEEMVHEITKDIQQLDQAKRNLTVSITTLNNLIIIVNALDRLNALLQIDTQTGTDRGAPSATMLKAPKTSKDSSNPFGENGAALASTKNSSANSSDQLSLSLVTEVSDLLAQAQRLMQPMMAAYGSVPSVNGLSQELDTIHSVLADRLCKELKSMLTRSRNITDQAPLIQAACQLMELLPEALQVKPQILNWFILRQLGEYKELFDPSQTSAWLDKIDHRYAWLRTNLPPLERKLQVLFPAEWHVSEKLVIEFCRMTKADLETVMQRRQAELTHNLIIFGLQRTLAFEASLNKIYSDSKLTDQHVNVNHTGSAESHRSRGKSMNPFDDDGDESGPAEEDGAGRSGRAKLSAEGIKSAEECGDSPGETEDTQWKKQPFDGIISSCFDSYFELYLNHVEKALREQLQSRFIGDFTVNKSSLTHRELNDVFRDDSSSTTSTASPADPGENTLTSATELFLLYRQVIKQTLQLNRGKGLLGLVRLLRQYLSEYTVWVLLAQIPGLSIGAPTNAGSSGAGFFAPDVGAKMAAFGLSGLSALGINRAQSVVGSDSAKSQQSGTLVSMEQGSVNANQLFASLLRDESQLARLTKDDIHKVCVVLVTAAFCLKTVEELEKRLKMEIRPPSWSAEISFATEIDGFAACRGACVHRLVSDLESAAEPHLATMARLPWNNLVQVGDQSIYITEIIKHLRAQVPLIRDTLYSVRATFTQICIKFAGALITRFIASLYRCKPVNTFGAEQLLLDTQSLKSALIQMPVFGAKFSQAPPRSFTNLVHEGMGRAERIIKAVMLPVGSPAPGQPNHPEPGFGTSTGFVMGPVDAHAAELFLASYRQLIPDATASDLQKVLEMKGVKSSELQLILDLFRTQSASAHNPKPGASTGVDQQTSAGKDEAECKPGSPSDRATTDCSTPGAPMDSQSNANRIGPLEKLAQKTKR